MYNLGDGCTSFKSYINRKLKALFLIDSLKAKSEAD